MLLSNIYPNRMVREEFGNVPGFVQKTNPTNFLVWLRPTHVCRERSVTRAATGRRNVIELPLAEILKRLVSVSSQLLGAQPAFAYERVVLLFRYPSILFDGRGLHVLSQLLLGSHVLELFAEQCPFRGVRCLRCRHV